MLLWYVALSFAELKFSGYSVVESLENEVSVTIGQVAEFSFLAVDCFDLIILYTMKTINKVNKMENIKVITKVIPIAADVLSPSSSSSCSAKIDYYSFKI